MINRKKEERVKGIERGTEERWRIGEKKKARERENWRKRKRLGLFH